MRRDGNLATGVTTARAKEPISEASKLAHGGHDCPEHIRRGDAQGSLMGVTTAQSTPKHHANLNKNTQNTHTHMIIKQLQKTKQQTPHTLQKTTNHPIEKKASRTTTMINQQKTQAPQQTTKTKSQTQKKKK